MAKLSAVAAVAVLAQACAQARAPEPPPEVTFRQTAETAPADLQLVCAGEAARAYQLASERVLPVASSMEGDTYTVVLNADGSEAVCTIDSEGNVLSMVRT